MDNLLRIKNKEIGVGKPLVCIPVVGENKTEIISSIVSLSQRNVEMIEWRVDAFEHASSLNLVQEVLNECEPFLKDIIFLFTYRSKDQGGMVNLDENYVVQLHELAAVHSAVDIVDLEYFEAIDVEEEIERIKHLGASVIVSHHDFADTPDEHTLNAVLEEMRQSGADIVKIAVMPKNMEDVLRLLKITEQFHGRYPKQPIITMSMGEMGMISRLSGEIFGACVTFGADGVCSAPGQIPMADLNQMLNLIHNNITQ